MHTGSWNVLCRKLEALRLDDETSMYDIMNPVALDVDDKLNLGQTYSTRFKWGQGYAESIFREKETLLQICSLVTEWDSTIHNHSLRKSSMMQQGKPHNRSTGCSMYCHCARFAILRDAMEWASREYLLIVTVDIKRYL